MARPALTDAREVEITRRSALRDWLTAHHGDPVGAWIVSYKAADPARHVPYTEIVDECLCFGWVDSLPRKKDAARTMLWISPRRAGSNWSAVNKAKVAALEAAGLMQAPGRAAVDRAKQDGSWSALDAVDALEVPPDLRAALDRVPGSAAVWDGFPPSVRRGVLEQLVNAKRPETREGRIRTIIDSISRGERPFQWRKS